MLRKLFMISVALVIFSISHLARAAEQEDAIQSFVSHITINKDASIDVTEYITVYTNGQKADIVRDSLFDNKNMFTRYIPIGYVDGNGNRRNLQYTLNNVLLNDEAYKYKVYISLLGTNVLFYNKISIGNNKIILSKGTYTYTISYHIPNAVNFHKNADGFYWDITGAGWKLPISTAKAVIQLPEGAVISEDKAYISTDKQKDQAIQINKTADNQIELATSTPLNKNSSIIVNIAWQKGIVTEPNWMQINKLDLQVFIIVSLVLIYYLTIWMCFGRDSRKKPAAPIFEPPANITPEEMNYIYVTKFDGGKLIACSIVNMAVNGYLTINKNQHPYQFILNKTVDYSGALPEIEKNIAKEMFTSSEFKIGDGSTAVLSKIMLDLRAALKIKFDNLYFTSNFDLMLFGYVLSIIAFLLPLIHITPNLSSLFALNTINGFSDVIAYFVPFVFYNEVGILTAYLQTMILVCTYLAFCVGLVFLLTYTLFVIIYQGQKKYINSFIVGSLILIPLTWVNLSVIFFLSHIFSFYSLLLLSTLAVINYIFWKIISAPTASGKKIIEQIEGFRLYLKSSNTTVAVQDNAPALTPELFEKYLPYAMALDVVDGWCTQFENAMKKNGQDINDYRPAWYITSQYQQDVFVSLKNDANFNIQHSIAFKASDNQNRGQK